MIRPSPFVRRWFAAFAAVMVLFAPVTQVAHAQAMLAHVAADCDHPAMAHQQMPASGHHTQQHQHGGTCCDFCATGCATAVVLLSRAAAIPTPAIHEAVVASVMVVSIRIAPAPHLLPFSQAPPLLTV
jgi:hypothetical protein